MNEPRPRQHSLDDDRVVEALYAYKQALEAGERPDRASLLDRFPELADDLAACLDGLDFVHLVVPELRDGDPGHLDPDAPLGDFRLVREVGRGGMGVVYEAEQMSLGRRVALKVLPFAAVLDPRYLQRFRHEAQAAAHLHHTSIVPVYAVGCDRGVHYYAMQFIEGRTVAGLVDELRDARGTGDGRDSSPALAAIAKDRTTESPEFCRAVARLGIQAAEALDHAHESGIVHRDVKPPNLIVDDRGHLWVTDFGLASTRSDAGLTMTGDIVGTLRYMSPEQTRAQRVGVDHRTDIYSLGATLYELHTLERAFPGDDPAAIMRAIAAREPPRPRSLNAAIPRELETILLKAMAKGAPDRYATAQDLADDLRRFLEDRPIRARRPSLSRRAMQWGRRHRAVVRATGLVMLLAFIGLSFVAVLLARERNAKARLSEELRLEVANAKAERERVELWFGKARAAIDAMEARAASLSDYPHMQDVRRELLEEALAFYLDLEERVESTRWLRSEVGLVHVRLSSIYRELGQHQRCLEAAERAHTIWEALSAEFPDNRRYFRERARSAHQIAAALADTKDFRKAEGWFRRAIALWNEGRGAKEFEPREIARTLHDLAVNLARNGRRVEAEGVYRDAVRILKEAQQERTDDLNLLHLIGAQHALAYHLFNVHGAGAEALARENRLTVERLLARNASREVRARRGDSWSLLGSIAYRKREFEEAVGAYKTSRSIWSQLQRDFPAVADYTRKLAHADSNLAETYLALRRAAESRGAFARSRNAYLELSAASPETRRYRFDAARSHWGLARALEGLDPRAADKEYARLIEDLSAIEPPPSELGHRRILPAVCHEYADLLVQRGEVERAVPLFARAAELNRQLVDAFPLNETLQVHLLHARYGHSRVLSLSGRDKDARQVLQDAVAATSISHEALSRLPPHWRRVVWAAHADLGTLHAEAGAMRDAVREYRRALDLDPNVAKLLNGLAWIHATATDPALLDPEEAVRLASRATDRAPGAAPVWNTLGVARYRAADYAGSVEALRRSMKLSKGGTGDAYDWLFLAMAHARLGDAAEARRWYDRASMKTQSSPDAELVRFRDEARKVLGIID